MREWGLQLDTYKVFPPKHLDKFFMSGILHESKYLWTRNGTKWRLITLHRLPHCGRKRKVLHSLFATSIVLPSSIHGRLCRFDVPSQRRHLHVIGFPFRSNFSCYPWFRVILYTGVLHLNTGQEGVEGKQGNSFKSNHMVNALLLRVSSYKGTVLFCLRQLWYSLRLHFRLKASS